jgi:signal peptidase II
MSVLPALALALAVIGVDRVTKLWILASLERGEAIHVLPGFFSIVHVRNPGAAFGLLAAAVSPWREIVLVAVSGLAVAIFAWMLFRMPREAIWERGAAAAVIGGALGNLHDRIVYGEVVDFLDFYVGAWHWPAFNVADMSITLGIAVLVLTAFRDGSSESGT